LGVTVNDRNLNGRFFQRDLLTDFVDDRVLSSADLFLLLLLGKPGCFRFSLALRLILHLLYKVLRVVKS